MDFKTGAIPFGRKDLPVTVSNERCVSGFKPVNVGDKVELTEAVVTCGSFGSEYLAKGTTGIVTSMGLSSKRKIKLSLFAVEILI